MTVIPPGPMTQTQDLEWRTAFTESWYDTSSEKWLFTTYEHDAESGNDYAMMRYSVNRLARFSSPDPLSGSVGNPQSLNHYSYGLNDPGNLVDPTGLFILAPPDPPGGPSGGGYGWPFLGAGIGGGGFGCSANEDDAVVSFSYGCTYTGFLNYAGSHGGGGGKAGDVINAALKEKNLSKCLHEYFGPGTILTNENLPHIDASKDLSGGAVGRTDAGQVPDVGRGTVQITASMFNNLSANDPFLTGTYLHETANALAIQRFTDIQPRAARMERGPLGGPPTPDQQKERQSSFGDPDIGNQFEKYLREN